MTTQEINRRIDRICKSLGPRQSAAILNALHACRPDHPWNKTAVRPYENALLVLEGVFHNVSINDIDWLRQMARTEAANGAVVPATAGSVATFAPGPYRVRIDASSMNASIRDRNSEHVAEVWSGRNPSMAKVRANAALLSAAPTMYDAISRVMHDPAAAPVLRSIPAEGNKSLWDMLQHAAQTATTPNPETLRS